MQQPTGVDEMSTVNLANHVYPSSREKRTIFRCGILLPKIKNSPIKQLRIGQWITFPLSITEMFHLKTNISDFISPFINDKKRQRHDWNPIAHNTRLSSSSVNPKLNQRLEPESLRLLTQLWIDAYSKVSGVTDSLTSHISSHNTQKAISRKRMQRPI